MSDNPKFTIPSTGKDYKIIRENVTWSQAVENSIIYGGNLAQFETDLEAQNFWDVFSSSEFYENLDQEFETSASEEGGAKYIWLGANDAISEGTWKWIQDLGDGVELRNFGTFRVKTQKASIRRNPKTGEKVAVPEKKVISWKMSKEMFKKINNEE